VASLRTDVRSLAEVLRALAEASENPEPHLSLLAELGVSLSRPGFTELFDFELPPYLSFFLTKGPVLGGEPTERTREFLAAYAPDLPTPVLCDHLGFLLAVAAAALDGEAIAFLRAHVWEQLAPVWPLYARAANTYGPPEYRPWAEQLARTLEALAVELGEPTTLPLHLRAAPAPEPPEDEEGLVELCLSPVLSGVILTRSAILTASQDSQIPVRYGGRRFSFRSLVQADPRAALRLMRRLALAQARWRLGEPFAIVEQWWQDRRCELLRILDDLEQR